MTKAYLEIIDTRTGNARHTGIGGIFVSDEATRNAFESARHLHQEDGEFLLDYHVGDDLVDTIQLDAEGVELITGITPESPEHYQEHDRQYWQRANNQRAASPDALALATHGDPDFHSWIQCDECIGEGTLLQSDGSEANCPLCRGEGGVDPQELHALRTRVQLLGTLTKTAYRQRNEALAKAKRLQTDNANCRSERAAYGNKVAVTIGTLELENQRLRERVSLLLGQVPDHCCSCGKDFAPGALSGICELCQEEKIA